MMIPGEGAKKRITIRLHQNIYEWLKSTVSKKSFEFLNKTTISDFIRWLIEDEMNRENKKQCTQKVYEKKRKK